MSLGHDWSAGQQLILGSPTGLPGYGAHAFSGQQKLLMNVQYRYFSPISVWIFSLGGALFGASGAAWNSNERLSRQQFHTSVGFGFRIENSTQQGSGIIRIDFPFTFDERRFTEVVISSDQLFKAFSDILYIAPNILQYELLKSNIESHKKKAA